MIKNIMNLVIETKKENRTLDVVTNGKDTSYIYHKDWNDNVKRSEINTSNVESFKAKLKMIDKKMYNLFIKELKK